MRNTPHPFKAEFNKARIRQIMLDNGFLAAQEDFKDHVYEAILAALDAHTTPNQPLKPFEVADLWNKSGQNITRFARAVEMRCKQPQPQPQQTPIAFEFYNPKTGHAIVDYGEHTYVGKLTADKGYIAKPLYASPPQRQPLTNEQVTVAARVLSDRCAESCGTDKDDEWAIFADDFKADARAALEAAHGIKENT